MAWDDYTYIPYHFHQQGTLPQISIYCPMPKALGIFIPILLHHEDPVHIRMSRTCHYCCTALSEHLVYQGIMDKIYCICIHTWRQYVCGNGQLWYRCICKENYAVNAWHTKCIQQYWALCEKRALLMGGFPSQRAGNVECWSFLCHEPEEFLTHWGLVMPIGDIDLGQHGLR